MKLFELVQVPTISNTSHVQSFMAAANPRGEHVLPSGDKIKILGTGVEAIVFTEPGDIGVVKVMTTANADLNKNPYLRYINVTRRYAGSNPFLPRITQISRQHVGEKEWEALRLQAGVESEPEEYFNHPPFLISFKMEKLNPIINMNEDQLAAAYRKAFGEELPEGMDGINRIIRFITQQIYHSSQGTITRHVDPLMMQALKIISSVQRKTDAGYDLHPGNIMVRMAVGGPQLVFTDPLVGL